jgi:tetratricopeptide (TPR) repeat protein
MPNQLKTALPIYYYAVSVWRLRSGPADAENSLQVESLLQRAVHLDPKLGPAFLQLGILYSERKDLPRAISSYERAIEASPRLEEAHYRLAQAYRQDGQAEAQRNCKLINNIQGNHERGSRHDIQQFVYTLRTGDISPMK